MNIKVWSISNNGEPIKGIKIKRNDKCKCGSGKKFKKCCYSRLVVGELEFVKEYEKNKKSY